VALVAVCGVAAVEGSTGVAARASGSTAVAVGRAGISTSLTVFGSPERLTPHALRISMSGITTIHQRWDKRLNIDSTVPEYTMDERR
jgi:hypothetical protein